MQVQRVQNNYQPLTPTLSRRARENSVSFGAKVKISGWTDDITSKMIKSWEKKAKEIGRDT